eukprot:816648-Rhodomonas_salina.6
MAWTFKGVRAAMCGTDTAQLDLALCMARKRHRCEYALLSAYVCAWRCPTMTSRLLLLLPAQCGCSSARSRAWSVLKGTANRHALVRESGSK